MVIGAFLSLSLLASSAFASRVQTRSLPVTCPVAINVNTGGVRGLLARDRARAKALFAYGQAKAKGNFKNFADRDLPVPLTHAGVSYTAEVGVGAGTYSLLVDTGSANTWVGAAAGKAYQPGPNSQDTGETVHVEYGSGQFSGEEFIDDVILGSATIQGQSIGVASNSTGLDGFDGILGIGPTSLTSGTTSGGGEIPTVTDNLFSQGTIDASIVGVSFVPTTSESKDQNGQLDFGGTDPTKFTGDISFVPITSTSPANQHWGVDQSITYGSSGTKILSLTAGIVDTGTTLVLLATDAFQAYQQATGAKPDNTTGLLKIDNADTLESLFFSIGDVTYEFTANAQIWPRILNKQIGGAPDATYLIVSDMGTPSGQGLDFTNGFTFLQRFYSVYDTGNNRVGLATSPHTFDTTN